MPLRQLIERDREPARKPDPDLFAVTAPLQDLLAGGGDMRLRLQAQQNAYGCTPFPRPWALNFGSSTASTISQSAFALAQAAQARLLLCARRDGLAAAFDGEMEACRHTLRRHWDIESAEVVFSPSGTDAQLQILFLAKALLGERLATIIVGSDQTGSGTVHTAHGRHFSSRTSRGAAVEAGTPIGGLGETVRSIAVPFCDVTGYLRSESEMDAAVHDAVAGAIAKGEKVLLQTMDSSKLGWGAPSAACLAAVTATWPDKVCIVVDACQMRLGRARLRHYLDQGFFVLATGSKFFSGPPFSGALLVSRAWAGKIDRIRTVPRGLGDYTTCFDWPRRWQNLRRSFSAVPNYGQWLRWQAALAEMSAYFAVPADFRDGLLETFAYRVPDLLGSSPHLQLLTERRGGGAQQNEELQHRSIHNFTANRLGRALSLKDSIALYRAMGHGVSGRLPYDATPADRRAGARICQIGQPVALGHRPAAVLRLCASARTVSESWARGHTLEDGRKLLLAEAGAVVEKLDLLIAHAEVCESPRP